MKRYFLAGCVMASALSVQAPVKAATTFTVSPTTPHPDSSVALSGAGFAANEAVDIYLDTTDTLLLVSSASGAVSGSITVPDSASPGTHFATAIGRRSGDAAQIAFTVTTPWKEFGFGSGHANFNAYENTINTGNVASLGARWSKNTRSTLSSPVIVNGKLYIAPASGIEALSPTTGATIWLTRTSDTFEATPAISGSLLYIGSASQGAFTALNTKDGSLNWKHIVGGTTRSAAVVVGNLVYFGCDDDKVYALNATTGAVVWTYTTGGAVESSPAVVDGILYVGSLDDSLYALDAATGALLWKYTTGSLIASSPAVSNGAVYFGSYDDKVYALTAGANGGSLLWSATTGGVIYGSPAVANRTVVIGSEDGNVYAFDARNGTVRWSVAPGGAIDGTPAIANGIVYIGTDNGQYVALDINYGGVLSSAIASPFGVATPAVSDGVVYLNGEYGNTMALALKAGSGDAAAVRASNAGLGTTAVRGAPSLASLHPDMSLVVGVQKH